MNAARWQEIKRSFDEVLKLEPSRRAAYIESLGATDADLRHRVESLLAEHENEGDEFLLDPAAGLDIFRNLVETDPWLGRHIGPYELVQELGSGGMGEVYLARRADAEFEQRVAIKLIRSGQDSAAVVSRFKAERQILAGLDHPNIAKLLDGGRTPQGQPYFVMEYVLGPPITRYCDEKQLSICHRVELLIQACDGVQYAHQNAIIHRDLKPSNILVVEVDGKPVPRIIDFGLAKTTAAAAVADQTQLTRFGIFMGTPGYMSPEQADLRVRNIDTRADVYSLGAILYVLLTGSQPFETVEQRLPPFDEWLRRLREEEPPRPSAKLAANREGLITVATARGTESRQLLGEVAGDLDWITMKALQRDREHRYGSPADLAADLRRYLQHEPVLARPPSTAYQIRKYVRRHRVAAGALLAVVLSLAAGVALTLWQARVAGVAAREAHAQELSARDQALKVRQMSALSAEQAGDAASQLGFASTAVARLAYAVRLDPDNSTLRSHLLQLLEEQDIWWLPLGPSFRHTKALAVAFSPDGSRVATGSEDGSAIIWDPSTGRQLGAVMHHEGSILSINFSPDGRRLITASADHTARVWDAATGQPLGPSLSHAGEVDDAAFSHDGDRVVTASDDQTARVWFWRSGRLQGTPLRHRATVYSVQFSPDDARIATASKDHTARIWDAKTGRPLTAPLQHAGEAHYAQFSPDGERLVTASKDSTAQVWDARTGRRIGKRMEHLWVVQRAHFSPDGTRIITDSWDRTARVWDARTGKPLGGPMIVPMQTRASAFSKDGRRVFTVLQDGTVRAWDGYSERPLGALVRLTASEIADADFSVGAESLVTVARDGTIQAWKRRLSPKSLDPLRQDDAFKFIAMSPDSQRAATNSSDHTATVWDLRTGRPLLPPLRHDSEVMDADFSLDGTKILTDSADQTVRVWNAATGEPLGVPMRHERELLQAQFSPDGSLVLTISGDGAVQLWDALSGRAHGAPLHAADAAITEATAHFSRDGARVAAAMNDAKSSVGVVRVWDVRTGNPVGAPMIHATHVSGWSFSPDGTRIATVTLAAGAATAEDSRTLHLWDARTGAPLCGPIANGTVLFPPLQFTPDGTRILMGTLDGTVGSWDAYTGVPVGHVMTHEAAVLEVRVSPDGTRILSASLDQTARVWDARSHAPIGGPLHHDGVVWSARFSADGKRIVTASGDHTAQVWDAETHLPITGPMRHEWPVRFAHMSRDGSHVLTISVDRKKRRIWPVLSATRGEAPRLADFAEVIGGYRVDASNALVPLRDRFQALEALSTEFGSHGASPSDVDRLFQALVLSKSAAAP
jgi:WD40 repeat protein/serine/threonine protein kinase